MNESVPETAAEMPAAPPPAEPAPEERGDCTFNTGGFRGDVPDGDTVIGACVSAEKDYSEVYKKHQIRWNFSPEGSDVEEDGTLRYYTTFACGGDKAKLPPLLEALGLTVPTKEAPNLFEANGVVGFDELVEKTGKVKLYIKHEGKGEKRYPRIKGITKAA